MIDSHDPLYYADYLNLPDLLDAQHPESERHGNPAHEETLFIITHQTYELWFKQILHELRSILSLFSVTPLPDADLDTVLNRLDRIIRIQRVINQQVSILETMTPLDFLDFRDYLTPASGFQSVQFREIEMRLGLSLKLRPLSMGRFRAEDREYLEAVTETPSLFDLLDRWLGRMPFLKFGDYDFWTIYRTTVMHMLAGDQQTIEHNPLLDEEEKRKELKALQDTRNNFDCLFDSERYLELQRRGETRLSQQATLAALFIQLYRGEPMLQAPFRLLGHLMDIDEQLTAWRGAHALMVHRMVGTKIGTGGSSGHEYLKSTVNRNRIFADLFNLSTFLIPRSELPDLPVSVKRSLGFSATG